PASGAAERNSLPGRERALCGADAGFCRTLPDQPDTPPGCPAESVYSGDYRAAGERHYRADCGAIGDFPRDYGSPRNVLLSGRDTVPFPMFAHTMETRALMLRHTRLLLLTTLALPCVYSQEATPPPPAAAPASPDAYTIESGTRIPLALISSVSTKSSTPGDRIYLETAFPIVNANHIVIPTGSYVTGTVTEVKRPGRVKGRGELSVRFDSITLPNGITRDFRSRLGSVDARSGEKLDKKEGQVISDSNKGGDAKTVATGGMGGATIGAVAGSA